MKTTTTTTNPALLFSCATCGKDHDRKIIELLTVRVLNDAGEWCAHWYCCQTFPYPIVLLTAHPRTEHAA